jgi:RNA polymerase sigma factor (sigma-70 family)
MSELDENQQMILEYQQTKDRDLLAKIIEKNKWLIKKLAHYSWKRDKKIRDLADCYQEIYLRFIDIVANYYDPTQTKLTTYMYRAVIVNYRSAMSTERIIQVPINYDGEYPIIDLHPALTRCNPFGRLNCDNDLMNYTEEGSDIDHAQRLHQKAILEAIWQIAEEFPENQYVMFYECFAKQKSYAEIGRQVGLTRERVRQVIRDMVKKIRSRMREGEFANEFSEHLLRNWTKFAKPGCCAPYPQRKPE